MSIGQNLSLITSYDELYQNNIDPNIMKSIIDNAKANLSPKEIELSQKAKKLESLLNSVSATDPDFYKNFIDNFITAQYGEYANLIKDSFKFSISNLNVYSKKKSLSSLLLALNNTITNDVNNIQKISNLINDIQLKINKLINKKNSAIDPNDNNIIELQSQLNNLSTQLNNSKAIIDSASFQKTLKNLPKAFTVNNPYRIKGDLFENFIVEYVKSLISDTAESALNEVQGQLSSFPGYQKDYFDKNITSSLTTSKSSEFTSNGKTYIKTTTMKTQNKVDGIITIDGLELNFSAKNYNFNSLMQNSDRGIHISANTRLLMIMQNEEQFLTHYLNNLISPLIIDGKSPLSRNPNLVTKLMGEYSMLKLLTGYKIQKTNETMNTAQLFIINNNAWKATENRIKVLSMLDLVNNIKEIPAGISSPLSEIQNNSIWNILNYNKGDYWNIVRKMISLIHETKISMAISLNDLKLDK